MASLSTIMMIALLAGCVTMVASTIGLIIDHRKNAERNRENRRQHISEINSRRIINYKSGIREDAEKYRRRA